jgi:hypothetical protein
MHRSVHGSSMALQHPRLLTAINKGAADTATV